VSKDKDVAKADDKVGNGGKIIIHTSYIIIIRTKQQRATDP